MAFAEIKGESVLLTTEKGEFTINKSDEKLHDYDCLIFIGIFSFFKYSDSILPGHEVFVFEARPEYKVFYEEILKSFSSCRISLFTENLEECAFKTAARIKYIPKTRVRIFREKIIYEMDCGVYGKILSVLSGRQAGYGNDTALISPRMLDEMAQKEKGKRRAAIMLIKHTVFGAA